MCDHQPRNMPYCDQLLLSPCQPNMLFVVLNQIVYGDMLILFVYSDRLLYCINANIFVLVLVCFLCRKKEKEDDSNGVCFFTLTPVTPALMVVSDGCEHSFVH
ncbi:hypothetical protein T4D_10519 [Trichinella pseudospiralis]|uniref:Uncharacterized protein n=1 Tax=Trichinella pseudospiralis TaxID=6337 RepID=A0A0V1FGW0_TRIPS|nr:hypothetical protein T4D_10519 [Trichinella pseudospiralis]